MIEQLYFRQKCEIFFAITLKSNFDQKKKKIVCFQNVPFSVAQREEKIFPPYFFQDFGSLGIHCNSRIGQITLRKDEQSPCQQPAGISVCSGSETQGIAGRDPGQQQPPGQRPCPQQGHLHKPSTAENMPKLCSSALASVF